VVQFTKQRIMNHLILLVCLPVWALGQTKAFTLPSDTLVSPQVIVLPKACELLSADSISDIFGVAKSALMILDPPVVGEEGVSSCFFKWADASTPHGGIFVQLMKNPAFDSYPDYISSFIDDKLAQGESMPGRPGKFQYTEMEAGGVRIAWCFEQSRFYWNLGRNHLCMLAFNLPSMGREEMEAKARRIISQAGRALSSAATR